MTIDLVTNPEGSFVVPGDSMISRDSMRLYRGLSMRYRSEKVGKDGAISGTDFTDCPFAALSFARGSRGVVLVVDVPKEGCRVSEELWSLNGTGPKRFMIWGRFDNLLVAEIPAKELRAQVRKRGVVQLSNTNKASILTDFIARCISRR